MVFLIVLLFTQSDEKTFFYNDSKINKYLCAFKIIINTALEKCLGKILGKKWWKWPLVMSEFTTHSQSPMQASICFTSITVVLLKDIKGKIHFDCVKVNIAFSLKQRSKSTTFIIEYLISCY